MLRKYIFIASVLAAFGMPHNACAQTTRDVTMKIQALLDQFSEIRSDLKQAQSSAEIEKMLQNLGGASSWKDKLKQSVGSIFDRKAKKGGAAQSFLVVPDGLSDVVDDPEEAEKWLEENMNTPDTSTPEEKAKMKQKRKEMKIAALLSGYGQIISIRKQLDKNLETIEKLKQDAEDKNSEMDLQNEINQLTLLKLEQINIQQLLDMTGSYISGADNFEELPENNK